MDEFAGGGHGEHNYGRTDERELPPIPQEVQIGESPVYRVEKQLGTGGFGQVYLGRPIAQSSSDNQAGFRAAEVALKFQCKYRKGRTCSPPMEWEIYEDLGESHGMPLPRVHYKGTQGDYYVMAMDLLGPTLEDIRRSSGLRLPTHTVACIAIESIYILEKLHSRGFIHGDVKPQNFMLGLPRSAEEKRLFLADLGLARRWRDPSTGAHVDYKQDLRHLGRGTMRYASVNSLLGRVYSRRDDLESLVYVLVHLMQSQLPWEVLAKAGPISRYDEVLAICQIKLVNPPEQLCYDSPRPFRHFADFVFNLKFDEVPNYARYMSLFHCIIGLNPNVGLVTPSVTTLMQNSREESRKENREPRKNLWAGHRVQQWISIYNRRPTINQRYHIDVDDATLPLHIEKGYADGMYISSVTSRLNLWAIVMDTGTGFPAQVYQLSSQFDNKEWMEKQWRSGYQITAIAGATNGRSLVVMSKGTLHSEQVLYLSRKFPYNWIEDNRQKRLDVTALATCIGKWAIVMSKGSQFSDQVVELDLRYQSEGVYLLQQRGYRITSAAANFEQVVFVLSLPVRVAGPRRDEFVDQEIFLAMGFPDKDAKERRTRSYYISSICYGKT